MTETCRLTPEAAKGLAAWLKLLANANRLRIIDLLSKGERTVAEIESVLEIRQPSLSQQLGVLREGGLVRADRRAKTFVYALDEAAMALIARAIAEQLGGPVGETAASRGSGRSTHAAVFATLGDGR